MNVEKLMEVVTWLENGALHVDGEGNSYGFNMDHWVEEADPHRRRLHVSKDEDIPLPWIGECGSVMCIGGATCQFNPDEYTKSEARHGECFDEEIFAANMLGLDNSDAQDLFYPWYAASWVGTGLTSLQLSPDNCAKVIRNLIKTGEVDWSILAEKEDA